MRLDAYLAQALPDVSRARVQLLIEAGQVRVDGTAPKGKAKLKGGEKIEIEGQPRPEPLHAVPENIPLDVIYEDSYLAGGKQAGGDDGPCRRGLRRGRTQSGNSGQCVALSYGEERPRRTIPCRSYRVWAESCGPGSCIAWTSSTSGAIVVAKDDVTHRKLGEMFAAREVHKAYLALAHGHLAKDDATVTLPIGRVTWCGGSE